MGTHNSRTLALIEAAIEARLSGGTVQSYSIAGRSLTKASLTELMELRDKYKTMVDAENAAADGKSNARQHRIQFTTV